MYYSNRIARLLRPSSNGHHPVPDDDAKIDEALFRIRRSVALDALWRAGVLVGLACIAGALWRVGSALEVISRR